MSPDSTGHPRSRRPDAPPRNPRARPIAAATALGLVATALSWASAAGFVALDLAERLAAARDAVVGTVVAVDVEVRGREPWTLVTLDLEVAWRLDGERVSAGDTTETALTAAFWGGRAPGAATLQVAGMPTFVLGERVLWLVRARDGGLAAPTVGVSQGGWRDVDGHWRGDAGSILGVDESGTLGLEGPPAPDALLFEALGAAFDALEPTP